MAERVDSTTVVVLAGEQAFVTDTNATTTDDGVLVQPPSVPA
ncbi:hypothetical protein [Haloarchaeobius sp. DT45]